MLPISFERQGLRMKNGSPEESSSHDRDAQLHERKHYSVTPDEMRRRVIALWATGTKNIKEVSEGPIP